MGSGMLQLFDNSRLESEGFQASPSKPPFRTNANWCFAVQNLGLLGTFVKTFRLEPRTWLNRPIHAPMTGTMKEMLGCIACACGAAPRMRHAVRA